MYAFLLLDLADYLENVVEPESFDMESWATGPLDQCNTAGCAVGWATKLFGHLGLHLAPLGGGQIPAYEDCTSWRAVSRFFWIAGEEAEYLFMGGGYDNGDETTPQQVAERIRRFVSTGTMEFYN